MAKLSEKQKRFIDFYIQTGNASEAARQAGYSAKIANRIGTENLSKPVIKNAIDARLKELESKRIAKTDEVLKYLTSVMRGEGTDTVVVTVGTGKGYSESEKVTVPLSTRDRLKAAEHLAKINGMFEDKVSVEVNASELLINALTAIWDKKSKGGGRGG